MNNKLQIKTANGNISSGFTLTDIEANTLMLKKLIGIIIFFGAIILFFVIIFIIWAVKTHSITNWARMIGGC